MKAREPIVATEVIIHPRGLPAQRQNIVGSEPFYDECVHLFSCYCIQTAKIGAMFR